MITIRTVGPEATRPVAALHQASFHAPLSPWLRAAARFWFRRRWRRRLSAPGGLCLLASDAGAACGFLALGLPGDLDRHRHDRRMIHTGRAVNAEPLTVEPRIAWIDVYAVDRAWRGRGIGRQLVEAALRSARQRDCTHVKARVDLANAGSLAVFRGIDGAVETTRGQSVYFTCSLCEDAALGLIHPCRPFDPSRSSRPTLAAGR